MKIEYRQARIDDAELFAALSHAPKKTPLFYFPCSYYMTEGKTDVPYMSS